MIQMSRSRRVVVAIAPIIGLAVVLLQLLPYDIAAVVVLVVALLAPGALLQMIFELPGGTSIFATPALSFVLSWALLSPAIAAMTILDQSVWFVIGWLAVVLVVLGVLVVTMETRTPFVVPLPWLLLVTVGVVVGASILGGLFDHRSGDDLSYGGFISSVAAFGEYPDVNPFVSGALPVSPRWGLSGWSAALGVLSFASGASADLLLNGHVPILIIIVGASAMYFLFQSLSTKPWIPYVGAMVAVTLPLIDDPNGNPSQFLYWYRAVQQDKYVALVAILPVLAGLFIYHSNEQTERRTVIVTSALVVSTIVMHPLAVVFICFLMGSYVIVDVVVGRNRVTARKIGVVAALAAPAIVAAFLMTSASPSFGVSVNDAPLDGFASRAEFGPVGVWHRSAPFDARTFPVDEYEAFFINRHLQIGSESRLLFLDNGMLFASPKLLIQPVNLLLLAGLVAVFVWHRKSRLGIWVIAATLASIWVFTVPPLSTVIASVFTPWQLWRFAWLLPVPVAVVVLIEGLSQKGRMRAVSAGLLIVGLSVAVGFGSHDELWTFHRPASDEELAASQLSDLSGVLLTRRSVADVAASINVDLTTISYRGPATMANAFPKDRLDEPLPRIRDRDLFFTPEYPWTMRQAILDRYDVDYLVVRDNEVGPLGIGLLNVTLVEDLSGRYALYAVNP